MAVDCQGTMYFSLGEYSWTEKYYKASENLTTMLAETESLCQARVSFLPPGPKINAIVVSSLATKGDTKQKSLGFSGKVAEGHYSDNPFVGSLVRLESGGESRAVRFFRPIYDAATSGDPTANTMDNTNQVRIDAFIEYLVKNKWCNRVLDKTQDNPKKQIMAILNNEDPNNFWRLSVPAHGFPQLARVMVSGGKGLHAYNFDGKYNIRVIDGGILELPIRQSAGFIYANDGYVRQIKYTLSEITGGGFVRVSHRQTKKGGYSPQPGRRKKR